MPEDLSDLVAELRVSGGDTTSVEAKSASGGLPQSLTTVTGEPDPACGDPVVGTALFRTTDGGRTWTQVVN